MDSTATPESFNDDNSIADPAGKPGQGNTGTEKPEYGWRILSAAHPEYTEDTPCLVRYRTGKMKVRKWLVDYGCFAGPKLPKYWSPLPPKLPEMDDEDGTA